MGLKATVVIGFSLMLTGCVTNQQQQIAADDARCLSYGVTKGSPDYVACRSRLDQQRSDRQALQGHGNSGGVIGFIERASQN